MAVRALCEFTAKHGDLDLRFTPSPSAQEGMAGHALVASRRGPSYESEVGLEGKYRGLMVRGRADGYDPDRQQLEEVKTYRGDLDSMADNRRALHWAQAQVYGWLLCQSKGLADITLVLVYLDVASLQETLLTQHFAASELQRYFEAQCDIFLQWAVPEAAHRSARDQALGALAFAHAGFRPGQRELAEAVYRAAQAGNCLLAQATTGIGKTMGTLYPLLKAMPRQRLDKVFFLAAKTPGRGLALAALRRIKSQSPAPALRVLELVARSKACEHPDKACHGESCPLAKGFYDRLPAARRAAAELASGPALLDQATLRQLALVHGICPYYLSQEMARWCDVVACDYNYYFDSSALLYNLAVAGQWRVGLLVDEAHNLLERARSMYSATLDQLCLQQVYASAPRAVQSALARLNRAIGELHAAQAVAYQVHDEIPASLDKALLQAITTITDFLVANPTRTDAELQDFYFELLHFSRMAEVFAAHSMFDITLSDGTPGERGAMGLTVSSEETATLTIRNVVPAPFLAPRLAAAHTSTLFSATLSPEQFYRDTLGLPARTAWIDVPSPFRAEQLKVSALCNVSTRYQHRAQSLVPLADLMARQYLAAPGNYLAFLSSYDYLQRLAAVMRQRHASIACWEQTRQMDEPGREQFLARFSDHSSGIGFAVLGGAFAEGVDLPGKRLIGAFIATLGMPQISPVNEEMRKRLAAYFGKGAAAELPAHSRMRDAPTDMGYNYTYLYPGLQKVVQAAGRVIRTPSDQGVIYLMDDRFTQPEVLQLLPNWWRVERLFARRA